MTKLLVAKVRLSDGSEHTIKTYADEHEKPKKVLKDLISNGDEILSYELVDTLSGRRTEWNKEHPDSPIPLNV